MIDEDLDAGLTAFLALGVGPIHLGEPEDACPCASLPVNFWRRKGEWIVGAEMNEDGDHSGDEYNTGGFEAWMIACPECRRVYAGDETPQPPPVRQLGDPRTAEAGWTLLPPDFFNQIHGLPPTPDLCSQCGTVHEAELPHDWQTMHWQYAFRAEHDRWPTLDDAFAHCDDDMHEFWRTALLPHGLKITPR